MNEVATALDSCGIGSDVNKRFSHINKVTSEFCAELQRKIISQAFYDLMNNVPTGTISSDEVDSGEHAIKSGISSAIGAYVKWDINRAMEIAASILEDVNAHSEAQMLRERIK